MTYDDVTKGAARARADAAAEAAREFERRMIADAGEQASRTSRPPTIYADMGGPVEEPSVRAIVISSPPDPGEPAAKCRGDHPVYYGVQCCLLEGHTGPHASSVATGTLSRRDVQWYHRGGEPVTIRPGSQARIGDVQIENRSDAALHVRLSR